MSNLDDTNLSVLLHPWDASPSLLHKTSRNQATALLRHMDLTQCTRITALDQ